MPYALVRRGTQNRMLLRNPEGQVLAFWSEDAAIAYHAKQRDAATWTTDELTPEDYQQIHNSRKSWMKSRIIYLDEEQMAQKSVSPTLNVDVFEDFQTRRFAIASRADNESEFITEVAEALAATPNSNWNMRLRELLPLIVDMCCKYRGYKAETVAERRELIAGDLQMPAKQSA